MLSASQLCFIVLLAAFQCLTQARRVAKEFDNGEGRRNVTKCGWNCKVIESDLPEELNKDFVGNSFIPVSLKYEIKVDQNHCDTTTFVKAIPIKCFVSHRPPSREGGSVGRAKKKE